MAQKVGPHRVRSPAHLVRPCDTGTRGLGRTARFAFADGGPVVGSAHGERRDERFLSSQADRSLVCEPELVLERPAENDVPVRSERHGVRSVPARDGLRMRVSELRPRSATGREPGTGAAARVAHQPTVHQGHTPGVATLPRRWPPEVARGGVRMVHRRLRRGMKVASSRVRVRLLLWASVSVACASSRFTPAQRPADPSRLRRCHRGGSSDRTLQDSLRLPHGQHGSGVRRLCSRVPVGHDGLRFVDPHGLVLEGLVRGPSEGGELHGADDLRLFPDREVVERAAGHG
jgi:hypothetical protein